VRGTAQSFLVPKPVGLTFEQARAKVVITV